MFAENRNVADGANTIVGAIRSFLNDHTVPYEKVAGLGSDGAAVMTGVHNGVGVQLKQVYPLLVHVHCMAHRLALAVSQAAGEILKDRETAPWLKRCLSLSLNVRSLCIHAFVLLH